MNVYNIKIIFFYICIHKVPIFEKKWSMNIKMYLFLTHTYIKFGSLIRMEVTYAYIKVPIF